MSKLRSLFENKNPARAWREVIIFRKGNLSINFRASRLLLWPLKGNSRLLFLISRDLQFHLSDLLFHLLKIITCLKQ